MANLRLPDKEVRVWMTKPVHHMLYGGSNLLWVCVALIHVLQLKTTQSSRGIGKLGVRSLWSWANWIDSNISHQSGCSMQACASTE